jgi:hypothetical protein
MINAASQIGATSATPELTNASSTNTPTRVDRPGAGRRSTSRRLARGIRHLYRHRDGSLEQDITRFDEFAKVRRIPSGVRMGHSCPNSPSTAYLLGIRIGGYPE